MSGLVPAREGLTTWLVATLRVLQDNDDDPIGIGDGIAPERYGWPEGQPGVGQFVPYGVVKTLQAGQQRNPQGLAGSNPDSWTIPYQLTGWGAMREQADHVCDAMNAVLAGIDPHTLRGEDSPVPGFDVQQLAIGPLGTTDRSDQTSPKSWSRTDVCTIWLARANQRRRG